MDSTQYLKETAFTNAPPEPYETAVVHYALGIAGECGEVVDLIKKTVRYGKPLSKVELCHELGDIFWYVTRLCELHGFTIEDALAANIVKLKRRYPNGYSNNAAITRIDVE